MSDAKHSYEYVCGHYKFHIREELSIGEVGIVSRCPHEISVASELASDDEGLAKKI